jgi:UDP-N-acetylmuramoyl-tripeptide--D-alanyl-D-alanine ligase
MNFQVKLDGQDYDLLIPIYGNHNVYNALFAIALSHTLGFNPQEIKVGLRSYHRPIHRLRVYKLKRDIKLIDDAYNANPNSVKAALDVLTTISKDKNVAVLGSMSGLGSYSKNGHTIVGEYAASKSYLSRIYTYGKEGQQIARAAVKAGFPRNKIIHSNNRETLHKHLKKDLQPGSTVLVKGSHSMEMSKTVKFIRLANT